MKLVLAVFAVVSLGACTPGAAQLPSGGAVATAVPQQSSAPMQMAVVDVNLTLNASGATPSGSAGGYAPNVTTIALGSTLVFHNSDSFAHTVTAIGTAASFPASSPFSATALSSSGTRLSQAWSSGTLQAGSSSQAFVADTPGTYLYGCFFHYGAPMRAVIVVK